MMSELRTNSKTVSLSESGACLEALLAKDEVIEGLNSQIAKMSHEMKTIVLGKVLQQDEINALKAETRSYQEELVKVRLKVQDLETKSLQEAPVKDIGEKVRMRYLERHRQRMGKPIGKVGYDHIKSGDRAAHRGRPLVDAWLYQTRQISDQDVYKDLYGITPRTMQEWKDIPEVVEISGFHASLRSESKLSIRFKALFNQCLEAAEAYSSPIELRIAFVEDKLLQCKQNELQDCYDGIIAANPPRQHIASSSS